MSEDYIDWHQVWSERSLGFHKSEHNPHLVRHASLLKEHQHILVPLCGKTLDLHFLHQHGHRCTGIELVPQAIQEFFSEWSVRPHHHDGPPPCSSHENITLIQENIFQLRAEDLDPIDGIYDRAALVALEPKTRQQYADLMLSLLPTGGHIFLISFEMPRPLDQGPPFSIPENTVRHLYKQASSIKILETIIQTDKENPFLKSRNINWFKTHLWWIEK